jgi:aminoglycoside phosphotransferase (APT) family kinase protein
MKQGDNIITGAQNGRAVLDYVRRLYPDLADVPLALAPGQGNNHVVIAPRAVVKILSPGRPIAALESEAYVLGLLARHNLRSVRIPALLDYKPEQRILRMTRLRGFPLAGDAAHEYQILVALSQAEQARIGGHLGMFLAELHNIALTPADRARLPQGAFVVLKPKQLAASAESLMSQTYADMLRWERAKEYAARASEISNHQALLHMDMGPANVLVDVFGNFGVIDFDNVQIADAHQDFIRLVTFFPKGVWQPALATYEAETGRTIDRAALQAGLDYYYCARCIRFAAGAYDDRPRRLAPAVLDPSP